MNIHAFICTRSKNLGKTTQTLVEYYQDAGINVSLIVNSKSIFSGYKSAFDKANPNPDDIIILCHDDIEVLTDKKVFKKLLISKLQDPKNGFVGVAGTTRLGETGVWWDIKLWQDQFHSGLVLHGKNIEESDPSFYGKYQEVVAMDGLFLAATARTLSRVGLERPNYLKGEWDFYDIHYTISSHKMGLKNYTVPITLLHNSSGELVGRDSWHINRKAFLHKYRKDIPITV
tara:strand:- start:884 stop:1573 length:690 start_codon:yes stop_codon:yes gene_type:complete